MYIYIFDYANVPHYPTFNLNLVGFVSRARSPCPPPSVAPPLYPSDVASGQAREDGEGGRARGGRPDAVREAHPRHDQDRRRLGREADLQVRQAEGELFFFSKSDSCEYLFT